MPDFSLLGLGRGGILAHFYSSVTLGALDSFFLVLHLLLLHVEQCVCVCRACVCSAHCSSLLEQFCQMNLEEILNLRHSVCLQMTLNIYLGFTLH